jgi:hypothetical protein
MPVFGLVLAAAVILAGCDIKTSADGEFSFGIARASAQDTWTRTYALAPGGRLELINVNGRIDAEPASGGSLELVATRSTKGSDDEAAKANLAKVELREEVGEARVRVEVRVPRFTGMSGHEVKWTIKVPKGVHVDLRNVNGSVHVTGLDGEVLAKTTNGGVRGRALASTLVNASTVNGGIDVELGTPLPADGRIDLESVNGGAELSLPAESKATISARAVNGGVRCDLDLQKTGEEDSRRRLEGTLNGGGARVSVQTVNGGVRISRSGAAKSST